jgi:Uncharacterized proteins, LmbE homologs
MIPETVVVVAAHPDDEVLGCGATIARHVDRGDEVHVVIVAEGATSRDDHCPDDTARLVEAACHAAAALGVSNPTFLGLPDNRLDSLDLLAVIKPIEAVLKTYRPTVVYTHHPGDLNIDHSVVHRATATASRPLPGSRLAALLLFEVVSSTEWSAPGRDDFCPSWFIEVSPWMDCKHRALRAYGREMRGWPHARSHEAVDAMARWRGASVGVEAAEAFVLHRYVDRQPPEVPG